MLKFLYVTDLHGSIPKYLTIQKFAQEQKIDLIHLGADLLPKGSGILKEQKKFINGFLKDFYETCKKQNIDVLASFGNDDIYSRKPYFKKYATLLDEVPYQKNGYEFKAYGFVPDYPFGLKTACKLDYNGWVCPDPYISRPVDCGPTGDLIEIPDVKKYFAEKGTIEDDLKKIQAANNTIMAIHVPPYYSDLDVCVGGRRVGSKSVYDWIKKQQPLLCLSGHIHENYSVTKVWQNKIGKTLVIQPGQTPETSDTVRFVLIAIKALIDHEINAELIERQNT